MTKEKEGISEKDRYLFYKESYFYELGEPNKILMRLPMLIAGLAVLLTIYFKILESKSFIELSGIYQNGIIIIASALIFLSIAFCINTAKRRTYQQFNIDEIENTYITIDIPKFLDERDNYNKLVSGHKQVSVNETAETMLLDYFIKRLSEAYTANKSINEERRKWFHWSLYCIFGNIGFIIIIVLAMNYGAFQMMDNYMNSKENMETTSPPDIPQGPELDSSKYTEEKDGKNE